MPTNPHITPTDEVKAELVAVKETRPNVRTAELATILRLSGTLQVINNRVALEAELHTPQIVQRVRRAFFEIYSVNAEPKQLPQVSAKSGAPAFVVSVLEGDTLARRLGLIDPRGKPVRGLPNRLTTGSPAELAAVWRGAFLARGTLSATQTRSATIEVVCPTHEAAMALTGAAIRLEVSAKQREIRGQQKVIVKDPDAIAKLLELMGAENTLTSWQSERKSREAKNSPVRLLNFDDANLRRSAQASAVACARVERALEILGDGVPAQLLQAGKLRLEYRSASLDELGAKAEPPLTKDAIAGRIRRLLSTADRAAVEQGIPDTMSSVSGI